jgi:peptidyl-dipeptidase A
MAQLASFFYSKEQKLICQCYGEIKANNTYQSAEFIGVELDDEMSFRFNKIKTGLNTPVPSDKKNATRLAELTKSLQAQQNMPCENVKLADDCFSLSEVNDVMANSTDPEKLQQVWQNSRKSLIPMHVEFTEKVVLNNLGAQRVGFENMAEMRSSRSFQMPAGEFTEELDRVWDQIRPLYESLQCHVKARLGDRYGTDIVMQDKPIPAYLMGDSTGSSFANLYNEVMSTETAVDRGYNLTEKLLSAGYTEVDLMRTADKFTTSMGFTALDESFYSESVFTKPDAYDVECDSGLWWLREDNQVRLVRCLNVTAEGFIVSHMDLASTNYQITTGNNQPKRNRFWPVGFAHAGEGAQQLLISPNYLKEIGLLDDLPPESSDLGFLMKLALDEVSSIPFNILVDKWRCAVASGEIAPKDYNNFWWQLRQQYQGIAPPVSDDKGNNIEDYFDAGAVAAVISNQDLSVNAVVNILKYQIHKNVCDAAGNTEVLSRCSTYNSKEAGNKLKALYNMRSSKTWSNTLATWADEKQLDGRALVEYFAPLQTYLDEQNKGLNCTL